MTTLFENPLLAVLALILGFGFLIFVHELGHFGVAKFVGIRCTQFAIGFGNALVSWRKGVGFRAGGTEKEYVRRATEALEAEGVSLKGMSDHARNQKIMEKADALGMSETEYRLNWLPLGGYVKMLGQEDMDPNAQSDDPRAFNRKPVWARAAVISAGVIMNIIFGLIFFIICFQIGVEFPAAQVGGVAPGSPAATTYAEGFEDDPDYLGLRTGDRILKINGEPAQDMADLKIATALGKGGDAVELTVDRSGETEPLVYNVTPVPNPQDGLLYIGVAPPSTLTVGKTAAGRAVAPEAMIDAGVEAGMQVVAVAGQPVADQGSFERAVAALDGPDTTLTLAGTDGERVQVQTRVRPQLLGGGLDATLLGLRPALRLTPMPESPAAAAGVEDGDLLARLGDRPWPSFKQLENTLADDAVDTFDLAVWRDDQLVELGQVEPTRNRLLGVNVRAGINTNIIADISSKSPIARALQDRPLPPGSRLLQVNGQSVDDYAGVQQALHEAARDVPDGESLQIELNFELGLAGQPTEQVTVQVAGDELDRLVAAPGWLPTDGLGFEPLLTTLKADTPIEAMVIGFDKTGQFIQQTYITLLRLIQGTIKPSHLRGPVGIVDEGAKVAAQGFAYYLFFLGLISVNLAVINFLPIPIVDGGLMVFLMIEKIKGSPASPKVQTAAMLVGLVLIAVVFLYVTYQDIARIVEG
jgi:regulator of sigma E protease